MRSRGMYETSRLTVPIPSFEFFGFLACFWCPRFFCPLTKLGWRAISHFVRESATGPCCKESHLHLQSRLVSWWKSESLREWVPGERMQVCFLTNVGTDWFTINNFTIIESTSECRRFIHVENGVDRSTAPWEVSTAFGGVRRVASRGSCECEVPTAYLHILVDCPSSDSKHSRPWPLVDVHQGIEETLARAMGRQTLFLCLVYLLWQGHSLPHEDDPKSEYTCLFLLSQRCDFFSVIFVKI